ncbi:hypothetical protein C0993_008413 [Termitomyces sp. T159_Od127]|nr:hypothetical protein C0993_008413 [Termitomyces sp. T159_Od127]
MSSFPRPAFTQFRAQSTFDELLGFFGSAPSVLTADERYHTTSNSTRKPGQFDKHLHHRLRLKRVVKLLGLLQDLLNNAMHALSSYKKDLPAPNTRFPYAQYVTLTSKTHRRDIHKEIDVQSAYETGVADFCATVAATLELQLSDWSPNCLQWSTVRLCNKEIPGVRRDQALADGFLNMSDKGSKRHLVHPTPRERLILDTFPVIAIWEFKNLNFDATIGQMASEARAEVFHEMLNGFLDSVFPWKECEKGDNCAIVHWKIGISACPMGNNAVYSSCQSYDSARKLELSLPERPPTGCESGAKHSARDILQQAWTEALVHDCTFLVINAGNVEIIGSQTSRFSTPPILDGIEEDCPDVTTFFEVHAQESFYGLRICRAKVEIPGVKYPKNFKEADKPWIILKNAFTKEDIFLLENESKVYDALNEGHVWSIPKKFGFFLSMDPSNKDANFAALLLEDKGHSLAYMKNNSPRMKFRVTRREKIKFHSLLRKIHDAGYLHGKLTKNSLLFTPERCDISIIGFEHSTSLRYSHTESGTPKPAEPDWQIQQKKDEHRRMRLLLGPFSLRKITVKEKDARRAARCLANKSKSMIPVRIKSKSRKKEAVIRQG